MVRTHLSKSVGMIDLLDDNLDLRPGGSESWNENLWLELKPLNENFVGRNLAVQILLQKVVVG